MNNELIIAQISDSHLFAERNGLHHGANVFQNLFAILQDIQQNPAITYVVFTGDLTQDHSDASYQLFAQAVQESKLSIPLYFLSGNHDEPQLLTQFLVNTPFCSNKVIESAYWQIILINSKSETPAGFVDSSTWQMLSEVIDGNKTEKSKSQLIFMHHHAIDVGYFIDKHGLINKDEFWQHLEQFPSVKAIACGHVHRGITLLPEQTKRSIPLYTCPATSIQFDPSALTVCALKQGPGYRLFNLTEQGGLTTELRYLPIT